MLTCFFIFCVPVPTVTLNTMGVMVMEGGTLSLCGTISDIPTLGLACAINVTLSTALSGAKGGERLTIHICVVS